MDHRTPSKKFRKSQFPASPRREKPPSGAGAKTTSAFSSRASNAAPSSSRLSVRVAARDDDVAPAFHARADDDPGEPVAERAVSLREKLPRSPVCSREERARLELGVREDGVPSRRVGERDREVLQERPVERGGGRLADLACEARLHAPRDGLAREQDDASDGTRHRAITSPAAPPRTRKRRSPSAGSSPCSSRRRGSRARASARPGS